MNVSNKKRIFKYIPKSQRGEGQKALTPIEDSMTAIMTSFTLPLRKIDQSLPKGKMQISITFGENSKKNKRVVTFNKKSPTYITLKSFKVEKKKFHVKKQKEITIHQNNEYLKASFEPDEFTEEEQKMFRNEDVPTPSQRVSVFEDLRRIHSSRECRHSKGLFSQVLNDQRELQSKSGGCQNKETLENYHSSGA